jgi:esterase/lipase superfamily enzyme
MIREYRKTDSKALGREMEMLIFGTAGLPVLAFPTSGGRFFEMEDFGMISALAGRIDAGELQLYCVDSVDNESWYNRHTSPRGRISRQIQYESYVLSEVVPQIRADNSEKRLVTLGCSFGGYHAMNIALRHPEIFTKALSLCGTFDLSGFLHGYYDLDCYYNLPTHYLPNLTDPWYLHRYARNDYILATGWDDHCLDQNCNLDHILQEKAIPHKLHIWEDRNSHGWSAWNEMARQYL